MKTIVQKIKTSQKTLPNFAASFKNLDLGLPKEPHRNVIWARILGLNEPTITSYMHSLAQQRRGELAQLILANQEIHQPDNEDTDFQ